MTMLVADGVLPSNEGRGYVLRRIIRRAILAARRAGRQGRPGRVAGRRDASSRMGAAYPVLVHDRDLIVEVLEREEAGFARTLRTGLSLLEEARDEVLASGSTRVPRRRRLQAARHPRVPRRAHRRDRRRVGPRGRPRAPSTRRWPSSASARARAPRPSTWPTTRTTATSSSATASTEFVGRDVARYSVETDGAGVLAGEDGVERAVPRRDALLRRVRRPGRRHRRRSTTETGRFEVARHPERRRRTGRAPRPRHRRGPARPGALRRDRPGAPRGHAPQPHRDPPAARRPARRSWATTCASRAPTWDRTGCASTSRTAAGLRDEEAAEILTLVNSDVVANEDVETIQTTKTGGRDDGRGRVLRRQVRRPRARRARGVAQPRVLRRHPRRPPGRHRPDPDS